ncbi:MAG: Hint domain-containing protein [Gemmobacter sp.]
MERLGQGVFVISWAQTEADGVPVPDLDLVAVGAGWRWTGEAVRVDTAQAQALLLEGAADVAELRRRAARMVRRLVGHAVEAPPEPVGERLGFAAAGEQGFVVTDGRGRYAATVVSVPGTRARLVMFLGDLPPPGQDLWIVETALDRPPADAPADTRAGGVICFTPGTMIATPDGERPVESIRPGDPIQTADCGAQEVLWTGHRRMSGARLFAMPHLRPIRIRASAWGSGRPVRDLLVSPRHRMLLRGAAARDLFNESEVLVEAGHMVNDHSILVDLGCREVVYVHLLLPSHQIVFANGIETESFHPASAALDEIVPDQRARLLDVLPGIDLNPALYGAPARRNLPLLHAVVGLWHGQICGHATRAVLPYDQRLARFPAYLQQLEMESNGKRVRIDGSDLPQESVPVVWGEPGTNGQHAFMQAIHQGTRVVPCEFLVAARGHEPHLAHHHRLLVANCLAQSEALMRGRTLDEARALLAARGLAGADLERQARHRVFPGNRPSVTIAYRQLTPFVLGLLIALYEHRVFVEGTILGINSFDQWGVELGKDLATSLLPLLGPGSDDSLRDGSTRALLAYLRGGGIGG